MPNTIAQDLAAAQERIVALEAGAVDFAAALAKAQADAKALTDLNAKLTADAEAATLAHKTALDEVAGKLTAEVTAHAATATELAEARKKLADPAYQLATGGDKAGVPEGGGAAKVDEPKTREQLEAEYARIPGNTMEGARARAEFRSKHKDELGL